MALTLPGTVYPGTDPDAWAALPKPPPHDVLVAFESLRELNVQVLQTLPADQWTHEGMHAEQGAESVEIIVRTTAGHDRAHLDQLQRTLALVSARTPIDRG